MPSPLPAWSRSICFLDRDRAVFANFVHGVGDNLADLLSQFAENGPTCAISVRSLTFFESFFSSSTIGIDTFHMPRCNEVGFAPAVTLRRPSR